MAGVKTPFHERVAVVTGAASGIGRAVAQQLADRGALVVAADLQEQAVGTFAAELAARGARIQATLVDVRQSASVERLISQTVSRHGRIDYLFNIAGTLVGGEMLQLSLEDWRLVVDTNLWGIIHGCHHAYAQMAKQGSGHILNMASGFGLIPSPLNIPYVTTKYAIVGLSESLRIEAASHGVRVTAACPGYVRTPFLTDSVLRGMSIEVAQRKNPFPVITADVCAAQVLAAVAANKPVVSFPTYVHGLTWLHRLFPRLFARVAAAHMRAVLPPSSEGGER
jgi:NAD(P)-dependent dehydrogenase (short-subunit alcohol dehydrogenase family)